jgi:NTE family protein
MRPHLRLSLLFTTVAVLSAACAAPIQRPMAVTAPPPFQLAQQSPSPRYTAQSRPSIGVAFGGGSARGIAHVGVIRWLAEHRIPIDLAAGTSMGGLIGGSFATGMDADEIATMLGDIDWDVMFGSSSFAYKNIRRKADARAYPTRLEFGLKGGLVAPTALNNGEQIELLLGRIASPYSDIDHFDRLPTPFRAVAVDLVSATEVVMDRGSLAQAMRATMSLPLIFPPVERDGRVLVDGGAMNNVPADVVRAMGADKVIAVNVGNLEDREGINYSMSGLAGETLDAMMRASTKASIASADVILDVPLSDFGSLDWRRSADLISAGYAAAEARRDQLLPLAVSEAEYAQWQLDRQSRRNRALPIPTFIRLDGVAEGDARRLNVVLQRHVGVPLVLPEIEKDLAEFSGLDRYETITWGLSKNAAGESGLIVTARAKPYAPPFMMLGLNLENTTSSTFRITATARYLAFGLLTSSSELRIDGTLGSNPAAWAEFYQPIASTALFIAPYAGAVTSTFNVVQDDELVAQYDRLFSGAGVNLGVNLGAHSDLRLGAYFGRLDADVAIGDPGLPSVAGAEQGSEMIWRFDTQDSPVVPSRGTVSTVKLSYTFDAPDVTVDEEVHLSESVTQLSGTGSRFWSLSERNRAFFYGGMGTSFDEEPLPPSKFALGSFARLGAYSQGDLIGSHYYVGTGGLLHRLGRLPDFVGGPIFAGAWLENGDAFDDWALAKWRTNVSAGLIMETLLGPMVVAGSAGFDGRWRTYIGVGRIFR